MSMVACTVGKATIDPLDDFSDLKTVNLLEYRKIDLEKYDIFKPWDVVRVANCYYIYDNGARNDMLAVVDEETGKCIKGVNKGNGPNELSFPVRWNVEGGDVTIYDGNQDRRYLVKNDSDSILYLELYKDIDVDMTSNPTFHQNRMAAKMFTGSYWIHYYVGKEEIGVGKFPNFEETRNLTDQEKVSVFRNGQQRFKPDGSKLVVCINSGCALAIYDCTDTTFQERVMIEYFSPVFSKVNYQYQKTAISKSNKIGFLDVACTDRYIYALYSGKIYGENTSNAYYGGHVLVYDWDGHPIKHYVLDKDLFLFNVDAERGMIYGTTNDPNGCIVEYKLEE